MKLIKKYFLFVAQSPMFWAWIISLAFCCLYFVGLSAVISFFDKSTFDLMKVGINLTIFLIFFLSAINMLVPKLMITFFDVSKQRIILIYRGIKSEIYQGPLWGKYNYKIFKLPHGWFLPLSRGVETSLIINFEVLKKNRALLVSLKLKIHFYGELGARDLNDLLALQSKKTQDKKVIQFEGCIRYVFEENNLTPEKREKIQEIVDDDTNKGRPLIQSIVKIRRKFFFPGYIFPNADITIKLISFKYSGNDDIGNIINKI